jgi:predicted  nucleic acid-binding Zn-ribbon protein
MSFVSAEYQAYTNRIRNLSTDAAADIDAMQSFTPDFSSLQYEISTELLDNLEVPELSLDNVTAPDYVDPGTLFTGVAPTLKPGVDFDDGSGLRNLGSAPTPSFGDFVARSPTPPNLVLPDNPGPAPAIDPIDAPDTVVVNYPDPPPLIDLGDLGVAPDFDIDEFSEELPNFVRPAELQDLFYEEVAQNRAIFDARALEYVVNQNLRDAFNRTLIDGEGTGLPRVVETEIYDRAAADEIRAAEDARLRAESEWSSRGFQLPGAAVLAAVREANYTAQQNIARRSRDLNIEFAREQIQQYRFVVEQGLRYEVDLYNIYIAIDRNARELATAHYDILRSIITTAISVYELDIAVYRAKFEAFESNVRVALGRIEAYRAQLETARLKSELNTQLVGIYEAQIRGESLKIDAYRSEVEAYSARLRGELTKIEAFSAVVNAYEAEIRGATAAVQQYEAEVRAEATRAQGYEAQVRAYVARVQGFEAQVNAEATKTSSINDVVRAQAQIYQTEVDAWAAGVNADTRRVESAVSKFRGEIEAYVAQLNSSEAQERLKTLGFEKEVEKAQLVIRNEIANIDRALQVLTTASQLELQKLSDAARINAQLASASMASLSLSANLSGSDSFSAGSSTSCSTNYSGIIGG